MSIVLFAIIGSIIEAGVGYWICFSVYALFRTIKIVADTIKGFE